MFGTTESVKITDLIVYYSENSGNNNYKFARKVRVVEYTNYPISIFRLFINCIQGSGCYITISSGEIIGVLIK